MKPDLKIYRIFTLTSIIILCLMLFSLCILAAKNGTEEALFGSGSPVVNVFSGESNTVIVCGGNVVNIIDEKAKKLFDIIKATILSPVNNVFVIIENTKDGLMK